MQSIGIGLDPIPADSLNPAMPSFELDPREVDRFVRPLGQRAELVYRLAIRGLCERCRGDRQFRERTEVLIARYRKYLPRLLKEAEKLSAELMASVAGR
jgi:hypothetical protein